MISRLPALIIGFLMIAPACTLAEQKWPPLPTEGFITGRAARKSDVDKGNAAFVLDHNGRSVGRPIKIRIPQYGYFKEDKIFVIIIQAEKSPDGLRLVGARTFTGQSMVGLLDNTMLLGTKPRH